MRILVILALLCGCAKANCLEFGKSYEAVFTDKNGKPYRYAQVIEKGSERGLCGSPPLTFGYAQQCLNHDMCQIMLKETPAGLGPNCIDEFKIAAEIAADSGRCPK